MVNMLEERGNVRKRHSTALFGSGTSLHHLKMSDPINKYSIRKGLKRRSSFDHTDETSKRRFSMLPRRRYWYNSLMKTSDSEYQALRKRHQERTSTNKSSLASQSSNCSQAAIWRISTRKKLPNTPDAKSPQFSSHEKLTKTPDDRYSRYSGKLVNTPATQSPQFSTHEMRVNTSNAKSPQFSTHEKCVNTPDAKSPQFSTHEKLTKSPDDRYSRYSGKLVNTPATKSPQFSTHEMRVNTSDAKSPQFSTHEKRVNTSDAKSPQFSTHEKLTKTPDDRYSRYSGKLVNTPATKSPQFSTHEKRVNTSDAKSPQFSTHEKLTKSPDDRYSRYSGNLVNTPATKSPQFSTHEMCVNTSDAKSPQFSTHEKLAKTPDDRYSRYSGKLVTTPATKSPQFSTHEKHVDTSDAKSPQFSTHEKLVNTPDDRYSQANPWIADFLGTSFDGGDTSLVLEKNSVAWDSKGPLLESYQLLGDSLFVRFADQVLKERAEIGENGKFSNGDCVSGQTIEGLMRRVDHPDRTLHPSVMVLIGTNDFLKGTPMAEVREWMEHLLSVLQQKTQRIVLLTVPPIPRLEKSDSHWKQWEGHNKWLKTLDNGFTVRVLDVAPLFLVKHRTPDMTAFERYMGYGKRTRIDRIHLNKCGLLRLNRELRQQIKSLR